jgi:hypothetical protein
MISRILPLMEVVIQRTTYLTTLRRQISAQRSMRALRGRDGERIGLTDDSPLRTRRGRERSNEQINNAGLNAGPLDHAILAPNTGHVRGDIGYSDDYVENSRDYHQRQKAKADRHKQRQNHGRASNHPGPVDAMRHFFTDHRGHFGGQNVPLAEHPAHIPLHNPGDVRSDLEARRRAAFEQTLGDARVHLDRRRSSSLPIQTDAHSAPSGILPKDDAAASVQLPPCTQEVRLNEEVEIMRQTLHDMATRQARMQAIIDRHPEVTSAAAQPAPRAPIRPVVKRLSQPRPHGPPRPSGHVFGGPAFRPFTQAAAGQGGHSGDIPRAHSYQPPLPPGPPPPRAEYAAPPRPTPVHTRLGPRPVPQGDPFSGQQNHHGYGPQHPAARPAGLPPRHPYAPTGYAAPPPSQYGGGSGYAAGYVGPAAGHSGSFHSGGGSGYHAGPLPVQFSGVYGVSFYFSGFFDGFVPVQPAKPLLIDNFLSISAISAAKSAPHKVLVDSTSVGPYLLGHA